MEPWILASNIFNCSNYKTTGNDVQYKIIEDNYKVYLLFQGTCTKQDVLIDAMFLPGNYHDLSIHSGFVKGWLSAKHDVFESIKGCSKKLIVSGHSMGAAYAQLAVIGLYKELGIKAQSLILFGTPRIFGDKQSRDVALTCVESFVSYENRMDVVPDTPFFYQKPRGTKIGPKFNLKQWLRMEDNHLCYPQEELYK